MNQIATASDTRIAAIEDKIDRGVSSSITVGVGGITFQNAGEVMEFAKMMAVSGSAVPKHLRGQPGACLGIVDDAIRFRTSPYALARKSYFVNDNLAYEAQVIAGIINAFAPLKDRPNIRYEGQNGNRQCIVTATFKTGTEREYTSPPMSQIHPKNSPLWKSDPDQQLAYYSLRAFARRWCPEVILGIYDVEEMRFAEMRDVSPPSSLQERLAAARDEVQEAREGFDASYVARETGNSPAEPEDQTEPSEAVPEADDEGSVDAAHAGAPTQSAPAEPEAERPEAGHGGAAEPASGDGDARAWLISAAKQLLAATEPGGDPDVVRRQYAGILKSAPKGIPEAAIAKAASIQRRCVAVCEQTEELDLDLIAGLAGCEAKDLK